MLVVLVAVVVALVVFLSHGSGITAPVQYDYFFFLLSCNCYYYYCYYDDDYYYHWPFAPNQNNRD